MTQQYDITFVGHVCFDEIVPFEGQTYQQAGSAVLCGVLAAVRTGRRIAAVVKVAPTDAAAFGAMEQAGAAVFAVPAAETTFMRVIHPSADVDVRQMFQVRSAGPFTPAEVPALATRHTHLAGVTDQEFTLELIAALRQRGGTLSADLQSFVRQVDPSDRQIHFRDVAAKREIVSQLDSVKLDVVEAKLLTGSDDLEAAAIEIASWGCPEVVVTHSAGVLARAGGRTHYEKFSNRSTVGRTGRGDTTFAAYLSWRLENDVAASLKFAAALVSVKMETPGPFSGTLDEVLTRMAQCH